jgi:hypothetical protein
MFEGRNVGVDEDQQHKAHGKHPPPGQREKASYFWNAFRAME